MHPILVFSFSFSFIHSFNSFSEVDFKQRFSLSHCLEKLDANAQVDDSMCVVAFCDNFVSSIALEIYENVMIANSLASTVSSYLWLCFTCSASVVGFMCAFVCVCVPFVYSFVRSDRHSIEPNRNDISIISDHLCDSPLSVAFFSIQIIFLELYRW